jgi:phosphoribosyl-AMP cyclohydrolase
MKSLEEGAQLELDFTKLASAAGCGQGLIPVAVQHADTHEVILVAYTNELAFQESMKTRKAIFWSTSRNELWEKGKTSGNGFDLLEAYVNCEQNSLLYKVRPRGRNICHTNNSAEEPRNCFYRRIDLDTMSLQNLDP